MLNCVVEHNVGMESMDFDENAKAIILDLVRKAYLLKVQSIKFTIHENGTGHLIVSFLSQSRWEKHADIAQQAVPYIKKQLEEMFLLDISVVDKIQITTLVLAGVVDLKLDVSVFTVPTGYSKYSTLFVSFSPQNNRTTTCTS